MYEWTWLYSGVPEYAFSITDVCTFYVPVCIHVHETILGKKQTNKE